MSDNLTLIIDGKYIDIEQTKTSVTSYILGVDVTKENDGKGFSTGFSVSSIKDPELFDECLKRYSQYALESICEQKNIDNLPVEVYFKIKNAQVSFNTETLKPKNIEFSFL